MSRKIALMVLLGWLPSSTAAAQQPAVTARKTPILTVDNLTFKDLNKNGVLDKYEDWRLPIEVRVADLISKMTLAEKAGLMVHSSLQGFTGPAGVVLDAPVRSGPELLGPANRPGPPGVTPADRPSPRELIQQRNVRWVRVRPSWDVRRRSPPLFKRHARDRRRIPPGHTHRLQLGSGTHPAVSKPRPRARRGNPIFRSGPSKSGFAAIGDQRGQRVRPDRCPGISTSAFDMLSPMADVATEPRWNRVPGTFGEDAKLAGILVKAHVEGFQGKQLGPESVMCVARHFPGGGAVKDEPDSHDESGKWQAYRGKHFDYHLIPFQAAIEQVRPESCQATRSPLESTPSE